MALHGGYGEVGYLAIWNLHLNVDVVNHGSQACAQDDGSLRQLAVHSLLDEFTGLLNHGQQVIFGFCCHKVVLSFLIDDCILIGLYALFLGIDSFD